MSSLRRLIPKYRARKQLRWGWFVVNLTQRGFSSWGLRKGDWPWNERTRKTTYNSPGPGSLVWPSTPKRRRRRKTRTR